MEKKICAEFRFENLGCWDNEIHETCLSSQYYCKFYPRGPDGEGDNFIVEVHDPTDSSRVELSYIGADGSLLCKQEERNPVREDAYMILPPGPKFEDYVRTIRNRDVLTLKLYVSDCSVKESALTEINVLEKSLKIPALLFKDMTASESNSVTQFLSNLSFERCLLSYEFDLSVCLVGSTKEDSDITIKLSSLDMVEDVLFHACVSLVDCHDVVVKSKDCKFVVHEDGERTLPVTFKFRELNDNDLYLHLRVKLISKDITKKCAYICEDLVKFASMQLNSSSEEGENLASPNSLSMTVLLEDLTSLYQDRDFSDFTLKCDNVTIPAHKNILSARSPVFKSMLSCDMQEAATGCVDIVDMDPSTLARFLAFLYTGRVQDLQSDVALKLYRAADKYQVPTLKKECVDFLGAKVTISNVCEILSLADRHQDEKLTSAAHDFILDNFNAVLCSEEWKTFVLREPLLVIHTLALFGAQNILSVVRN